MNVCCACGEDFTGLRDFDSHRVGSHASMEYSRRCLTVSELEQARWYRDRYGRWAHPRRKRAVAPSQSHGESRGRGSAA